MEMRIRFPELLKESGLTPYKVAQADDRISMSMAYRLKRLKGRLKTFDADVLEALCDVFKIETLDDLFERTKRRGK